MYKLYGNGIDDDAPAIQEMLDSGVAAVILPPPQKHYCIGSTLKIHSNQTLQLPETALIRLLPNSNCFMLINQKAGDHDISVVGGIWDYNNKQQHPHPGKVKPAQPIIVETPEPYPEDDLEHAGLPQYPNTYRGRIMRFYGVTRLSIHDLTLKDPVQYALEMGFVKYFTVENVRFDMNHGNPTAENMDGVHVDSGCRFGCIRNVQGTCYDDVVAINADDGLAWGPISDIQVDGVFGDNSLRAVRLLSTHSPVSRISISNIFGTYYQNCVSATFYYPDRETRGIMNDITIKNLYGQNAPRIPVYGKKGPYTFSFVYVDSKLDINHLSIENVYRHESIGRVETVRICANTNIKALSLAHVFHENNTGEPFPVITNEANIDKLYLHDINGGEDVLLNNKGNIKNLHNIE